MNTIKEILRAMFYRYCIVFSLVMGANIIGIGLLGGTETKVSFYNLLTIVVMAALCALGDLFFFLPGKPSKRKELIRHVLHYIYINVVVFATILYNGSIDVESAIVVLVVIALIYWINIITDYYENKKDALKMNDLLEKINNNDE